MRVLVEQMGAGKLSWGPNLKIIARITYFLHGTIPEEAENALQDVGNPSRVVYLWQTP